MKDWFWSRIHRRPNLLPLYLPSANLAFEGFEERGRRGARVLQKPPICSSLAQPGLQTYFHLGIYQQIRMEIHQMRQIGKIVFFQCNSYLFRSSGLHNVQCTILQKIWPGNAICEKAFAADIFPTPSKRIIKVLSEKIYLNIQTKWQILWVSWDIG